MVGGGSKSKFWNQLISTLLNRTLSICDQSEFGAALGVARLAMFADSNITDKKNIVKEIKIREKFNPNVNKSDVLLKRYQHWKNIYLENKI